MWLRMAAVIAPVVRMPPAHLIRGQRRQMDASNSQMPCTQRIHGSVPFLLLRGPPRNVVAAISRAAGVVSAQESKSPDFTGDCGGSRSSDASWHSRCNRGNHYEQRNRIDDAR